MNNMLKSMMVGGLSIVVLLYSNTFKVDDGSGVVSLVCCGSFVH